MRKVSGVAMSAVVRRSRSDWAPRPPIMESRSTTLAVLARKIHAPRTVVTVFSKRHRKTRSHFLDGFSGATYLHTERRPVWD